MCEYAGIYVRAGKHSAPKSRYHHRKHEFHSQVIRVFSGVSPGRENWESCCELVLSEAERRLALLRSLDDGLGGGRKGLRDTGSCSPASRGLEGQELRVCPGVKPRPE